MYVSQFPVQLMTASERAAYRSCIEFFRAEAARMHRAANLVGDAPYGAAPADALQQRQKNQILELCARAVELCADRAEACLPGASLPTQPQLMN